MSRTTKFHNYQSYLTWEGNNGGSLLVSQKLSPDFTDIFSFCLNSLFTGKRTSCGLLWCLYC